MLPILTTLILGPYAARGVFHAGAVVLEHRPTAGFRFDDRRIRAADLRAILVGHSAGNRGNDEQSEAGEAGEGGGLATGHGLSTAERTFCLVSNFGLCEGILSPRSQPTTH